VNATREAAAGATVATMTVVVFFDEAAIGALARDRIRTLVSKHPARVIVLDATQEPSRERVDPADWNELGVKDGAAESLRASVDALRLPGAPIVLCWIAPGIARDQRFAALSASAETVVCNSSLIDGGRSALREVVECVSLHPQMALADIAYLRLAPWQESVAIFFDGKDAPALRDLQCVEIACGSEPEALYLLGWLASRLRWTPHAPGTMLDESGKRVAFAIRREGEPRRIVRIALSSSHSTFVAQADAQAQTILLSVSGSSVRPARYRPIENPGIAALVERAIFWGRNDRIFAGALAAAGAILAEC